MAVKFETIKEQILIVLYDYMLTSDAEAFWYSTASIRDALAPDLSGAFIKRAIDALVEDENLEEGVGDPPSEPENTKVFALTQFGIEKAEKALIAKGWDLGDYHPAPSADRIISRADEPELHDRIHKEFRRLAKDLRESNEAGEILGDDKNVLASELDIATSLTGSDRFRLKRLMAFILPTLQFIASKFFGSAIGEAAKKLVDLLLRLP